MNKILLTFFCLSLIHSPRVWADEGEDAYDPFIDYNEYEIADEEEADINFFRHGRFLTAGFALGQRSFTEGMSNIYADDIEYGLYLSYFFDMRFALQLGFLTGSHRMTVNSFHGDAKINDISLDLKYYLNTQNVTRGLASLNPYFIGGFSTISRQRTMDGQPEFTNDSAMAFDIGAGIELPMMQNKMYVGAQAMYQLVNFRDENSEIILSGPTPTGKYGNGDFINLLAILGINF
jgi:hypothetical protein